MYIYIYIYRVKDKDMYKYILHQINNLDFLQYDQTTCFTYYIFVL